MGTVPLLYGENEFFLIPLQTKERPVKLYVLIQILERQTGPVPIHQKPTKLIDLTVLLPALQLWMIHMFILFGDTQLN